MATPVLAQVVQASAPSGGGQGGGDRAPDGGGGGGGGGPGPEAVPAAVPGDISSLAGLAASLTPGNVATWASSDATLKQILVGPFEGNWFKAKDCLLMDGWPGIDRKPDHKDAIGLMRALVTWRAKACGAVQKEVEKEIAARIAEEATKTHGLDDALGDQNVTDVLATQAATPNAEMLDREGKGTGKMGPHVNFEQPKGNDKPSSDVDISTKGMNTELAVAMFNEKFKVMLGVPYESGTMFDYNVYAEDWVHNLKFDKAKDASGKDITTKVSPGVEHTAVADEALPARTEASDKASLLHIRRYCTDEEWVNYAAGRLKGLSGDDAHAMIKVLDEVDAQYAQFELLIELKSAEVKGAIDAAASAHESAWDHHKAAHFHDDAVRTSASNRIYEEKLREVKALRVKYALVEKTKPLTAESREELVALAVETTRALSDALYFANEVYATEGAVLHTVVGIQIGDKMAAAQGGLKPDIGLSKDQYEQSFNENVGDVMKDLTHFADNPPFAYFRAGKYMDRMLKAADALTGKAKSHGSYAKFADIATRSVTAKNSAETGDDPLACAAVFGEANEGSLAALRGEVMAFGAAVPALASEPVAEAPPSASPSPDPSSPAPSPGPSSAPPDVSSSTETAQSAVAALTTAKAVT